MYPDTINTPVSVLFSFKKKSNTTIVYDIRSGKRAHRRKPRYDGYK